MDNKCQSLADLMHEAFCLSLDLVHVDIAPDNSYLTPREVQIGTNEEWYMLFGWADGLIHKMYSNVSSGHCSKRQVVEFDIVKFEESVLRDIATMQRLLKEYGKPKKLNFAEMQRRGYTGKWAGL